MSKSAPFLLLYACWGWVYVYVMKNGVSAFSVNRHSSFLRRTRLSTSKSSSNNQENASNSPWSHHHQVPNSENSHGYICIITETDACDSEERMEDTISTLEKALGNHNEDSIDLISVRVNTPMCSTTRTTPTDTSEIEGFQKRLLQLCQRIMTLKENHQQHARYNDYKVVINDVAHINTAIEAKMDGIHVKEKDVAQIPNIREILQKSRDDDDEQNNSQSTIIGTSAHSIESGVSNWRLYRPDYMFAGTCYLTQSHPEKNADDLEGPKLPGLIKQSIEHILLDSMKEEQESTSSTCSAKSSLILHSPIIFAIGGIEMDNCSEPVGYGADGVAVIRSVMQASDPAEAVRKIKTGMKKGGTKN